MTGTQVAIAALAITLSGVACRARSARPARCEPQQIVDDMARDRQYALAVSNALGRPIAMVHPDPPDPSRVVVPAAVAPVVPVQRASGDAGATITLSIAQSGEVRVEGAVLTDAMLRERLIAVARATPEARAVIAASRRALHGRVVEVIDLVRGAGLTRFAIQTEVPTTGDAGTRD